MLVSYTECCFFSLLQGNGSQLPEIELNYFENILSLRRNGRNQGSKCNRYEDFGIEWKLLITDMKGRAIEL
jgi:hypothetical protein